MKKNLQYLIILVIISFLQSCANAPQTSSAITEKPQMFPDYSDVTIPYNIAPLNFILVDPHTEAYAILQSNDQQMKVKARNGSFQFNPSQWRKLLCASKGKAIQVKLYAKGKEWISYPPFSITVAPEPIDPYLAYRLIEPGYELWNQMGIYQRNLENFEQTPIMENQYSEHNCMNCHSFCERNPEKMLFHMRGKYAGTYLFNGTKAEKLNTKTQETISPLVYPSWHPSGKYVAFSVNEISQSFHANNQNRVEVFDSQSDVVVYDINKHEICSSPFLKSERSFETFPTFSPDGQKLYFCTADTQIMPQEYAKVKYSLCAINFNPETRSFGSKVDTLYNANTTNKSVSFPRISPNGKFLLFTLSDYGNFSIWHKDADLYLLNMKDNSYRPLDEINSDDTESYHSWSSNSHWIAFSSRRLSGLYTRLYFAYIDKDGKTYKPFLLPQKEGDFYQQLMKSYNIPEFITGKVTSKIRTINKLTKKNKGIDLRFDP